MTAALDKILQEFYMAGGEKFDGKDIDQHDVKKAIAYAKHEETMEASQAKDATPAKESARWLGEIIGGPIIATMVDGYLGKTFAGAPPGVAATAADQSASKTRGHYKWVRHSHGEFQKQAASTLLHNSSPIYDRADGRNAADETLRVILRRDYDEVTKNK